MENKISLTPDPVALSYRRHFQVAQLNLKLFIKEERLQKKKLKMKKLETRNRKKPAVFRIREWS
jgi:hypothetical protein